MTCPACSADLPDVARYCHICGHQVHASEGGSKRRSYAIASTESVTQFALISTVLPHASRERADAYRWALLAGGGLVVTLTLVGLLSAAVVAGAALVPVVYLVYLYDANVWEDAPLPVVLGLFAATGILGGLVTLFFFRWVFDGELARLVINRGGIGDLPIVPLLIFAVLLPLVAEVVKNIGGVLLARRPQFDDMIDGLTFGVAAGTSYAAVETVIAFSSVFTAPDLVSSTGVGSWLVIIINLMIVKSVIYGTATGIAVASFSGRGEGYDGFTGVYVKNFLFAVGANIAYWLGVRLLAFLPAGDALGLVWGLVVAAVLVVRVRVFMHTALLEAALEDAASLRRPKGAVTGSGWCPECELPLIPDAIFCGACGASLRATSHAAQHAIRTEGGAA